VLARREGRRAVRVPWVLDRDGYGSLDTASGGEFGKWTRTGRSWGGSMASGCQLPELCAGQSYHGLRVTPLGPDQTKGSHGTFPFTCHTRLSGTGGNFNLPRTIDSCHPESDLN
jgi:hypothetical protein